MRYKIKDVAKINERAINKKYNGTINYIDTSSVTDNIFNNPKVYSSIKEAPSRARRVANLGDTIISTVRPNMKHTGFIDKVKYKNCIYSTGFAVVTPLKDRVDPFYLYLVLTNNKNTELLQSIGETSTSTYPSVKPSDIENLEHDFPNINKQKEISTTIKMLENKIYLNNKINTNLEEINKLYFSNIFKNTTNFIKASDIAEIKIGKTPPRKEKKWFSSEKGQIWVSIKDMSSSGSFILDSSEYLINNATNNFNIQKVSKNTVILSFKLTIGRVKITEQDMFTNEAIAQFKNAKLPFQFLYTYLKSFPYETLGSTSSIAKSINSKIVKSIPILHPEKYELDNYMSFAESIFKEIELHQLENKKLLSIKDELLHRFFN